MTHGSTRSWRNGDAQCCQLSNSADPFSVFFPFKKPSKPNLVSENRRYGRASVRSCSPSARTHLSLSRSPSLSLSVCLLSFCSASGREEQRFNSIKHSLLHRYYVASLILHASIAEITAQLLSLSYVYLISSDDGAIIRIFVQINILEGRAGYVLMDRVSVTISYSFRCLTTETVKYTNENSFIENLASSKYSMWAQRGTFVCITFCIFRRRAALCAKM